MFGLNNKTYSNYMLNCKFNVLDWKVPTELWEDEED